MEYVQSRAGNSATSTVQASPTVPMNLVHHPSIVHSCDVSLSSKQLEMRRLRLSIHCAELSTGQLAIHPVMNTIPSDHLVGFAKIAEKHPVISFQNPAGRSLSLNLETVYGNIAAFERVIRYYEPLSQAIIELPAREIPAPWIFRLMPSGELVLTEYDPEDSSTERINTDPISREQISDAALELLTITDRDLSPHVPKARLLSPVRMRITKAFESFVHSRVTTFEERTEASILLHFAPYVDAERHLETDGMHNLTKEQKLQIMRSYHSLPGIPPPVHYNVLVRLD